MIAALRCNYMIYNMKKPEDKDAALKKLSEALKNSREASVRKEITDFSGMKPEVVAQLLRSWINSEK